MTTPDELRRLTDDYRRAKARMDQARDALTGGVRGAYAEGMRKADILRGIDHEWSFNWLDRILKTDTGADPEWVEAGSGGAVRPHP